MNLLQRYNYALNKRPFLTKMATSGTLGAVGDLLCQYLEKKYQISQTNEWNVKRTFNFAAMGAFFSAPILHFHFTKLLPFIAPKKSSMALSKKLIVDQLIVSPIFMAGWFTTINLLDGNGLNRSYEDLKIKFIPTMTAHWKVWPAVNFVNFLFIPIQYQVLFANMVSLFFNSYLSYMHNSYKGDGSVNIQLKKKTLSQTV
ncbi:peroxisomal membrane protein 2 [Stylonychia lemnae]|uniref:Peroxisomal membrane protein 2 n=1 Tax=Stylonychia lemnae TaxID=5949 RepID=A0A078APV2_STYLE|nr:peroxisomal membrane protein 2 [Stylonychia lemnae]|eukprot:CDW84001.1 peroxisomal membrane protein 2 [Stylonychia lemnae]